MRQTLAVFYSWITGVQGLKPFTVYSKHSYLLNKMSQMCQKESRCPPAAFHFPVLMYVLLLTDWLLCPLEYTKMSPSLPVSLHSHTWKLFITYPPTTLIWIGEASWQWSVQTKAVSKAVLPWQSKRALYWLHCWFAVALGNPQHQSCS